ncbi:NAD(P)-binding protein [Leucogyrophana mollusca]|uniref:NAD(P)-binding protein n=1 Tax=Leucogyrophana mollusca TaxID=85980 RepID=A0ACB8B8Y2_9AGAM|nr:NAD(P)-binding protein [Leucogyrophana mollusca]
MPALQTPAANQKVLVSGANGFIAVWVVRTLLERGYSVRSSVRTEEKGRHLKVIFGNYGDKHEIVVVPDMAKIGAFDEAVKGVDAIEHVASPVSLTEDNIEKLIPPAVNGTVGMLRSAMEHGASVKRIIVTASTGSIIHNDPEPQVFDESDWNEQSLELLAQGGPALTAPIKYRASKTLAEKAAWKFWEENQNKINWDMVVLHPPYVFGPAIHEVTTPSSLNTSVSEWYKYVTHPTSSGMTDEDLATKGSSWVDVRDLAKAHALALEKPAAGSKRIIISAGQFKWQDFIDAANALYPAPKLSQPLPVGNPGAGSANPATRHMFSYITDRATEIFGLDYRTMTETTKDVLEDFEARGW